MASATYRLIRTAILAEQQITCVYAGRYRELCPHILGHTGGEEKLLAFQFGGDSSRPLPPGGQWRRLSVAGMSRDKARAPQRAELRRGRRPRRQRSRAAHTLSVRQ